MVLATCALFSVGYGVNTTKLTRLLRPQSHSFDQILFLGERVFPRADMDSSSPKIRRRTIS